MDQNFLTIALVLVFVVMIFFMFRNSRKRKREQEEMQERLVPGVEVMTSHGIFGRIVSIDDDKNEAVIETMPGHLLRLHRQTLTKVVEPLAETIDPSDEAANVEIEERADADEDATVVAESAVEPEPVVEAKPKRAPRKRPAATEAGTE